MSRRVEDTLRGHPAEIWALVRKGTPFTMRLHFKGEHPKRGTWSDCWWQLEYDPEVSRGEIACTWGKANSSGNKRPAWYSPSKAVDKMESKLGTGYRVVKAVSLKLAPALNPLADYPAPYCDIRFIACEGGQWEGRDKRGVRLVLLTADAAESLMEKLKAA